MNGTKLKVSMARYNKGGSAINFQKAYPKEKPSGVRLIKKPSFRDNRKYSNVLTGKQTLASKKDIGDNVIPFCFTLNATENCETAKMLRFKGMFSLSPTKILIVLE